MKRGWWHRLVRSEHRRREREGKRRREESAQGQARSERGEGRVASNGWGRGTGSGQVRCGGTDEGVFFTSPCGGLSPNNHWSEQPLMRDDHESGGTCSWVKKVFMHSWGEKVGASTKIISWAAVKIFQCGLEVVQTDTADTNFTAYLPFKNSTLSSVSLKPPSPSNPPAAVTPLFTGWGMWQEDVYLMRAVWRG